MQNIKSVFRFIISAHICALLFFALHRGIELFVCWDMISAETGVGDLLTCFMRGIAFDTRCSCEALAIPTILLLVQCLFGVDSRRLRRVSVCIAMVIYFVEFAVCYSNVPYLQYQQTNLGVEALEAVGMGAEVATMVLSGSYLLFFVLGVVMCALFCGVIWLLGKRIVIGNRGGRMRSLSWQIGCTLGILLLIFAGIRGRMTHQNADFFSWPLKEMYANFGQDRMANLICLNPWFGLERDLHRRSKTSELKFTYMSDEEAERVAFGKLNYPNCVSDSCVSRRPHVFLIMLEAMSAHAMRTFGNNDNLTPFLDSLFNASYSFSRFYSAGTRTNMGIFGATTSQQVVSSLRMTDKGQGKEKYITNAFKESGYRVYAYVPHNTTFDMLRSFFSCVGVDRMYGMEDYGEENRVNEWGVNDNFLFNYAFNETEKYAKDTTPIFTWILTCSNHPTYTLPKEYMGKHADERSDGVFYSDEQFGKFYRRVRATEWGKDAMFVVLGDHGYNLGTMESWNHIPLIINYPDVLPSKTDSTLGTQADMLPTILSVLGIRYEDYCGTGVDLRSTDRDTIYYTASKLCIGRTQDRLFVFNPFEDTEELYRVEGGCDPFKGRITDSDDEGLRRYVKANIQATYNRVIR